AGGGKGVAGLDGIEDGGGAGLVGIDTGLIGEQDVLTSQAEDGKVAWKLSEAGVTDDEVGVRIGAADAGDRALLEEAIPLGEVFGRRAGEAEQGQTRVDGVEEAGDGDVEYFVFAPDGVVVEDLDAVVVGGGPVGPAVTKSVGMRDEVDGAGAAGGGHQGTGGEGGAAVPAIAGDAEGEEVAAGGADLFSVDDGEFGGIGG